MAKQSIIPKDIEQLKKDWWNMRDELERKNKVMNELRRKAFHGDKAFNLMGAFLIELDAERKEPGLLESLRKQIEVELLKAQTGMKVASGG
jgi:hypothetical protein